MENRSAEFDLLVIGGGINGAGIARDAALRGLRVALLEQADICHGTTRWSSRLIHGGLRYLEHYEFSLVRESLREREILLRTASHLVAPLSMLVPIYRGARRGRWMVAAGMQLYDLLSWDKSLPRHKMLDRAAAVAQAPGLLADDLVAAAQYYDAQVSYPERLVVENIVSARGAGATVLTYHHVDQILCHRGEVRGVRATDLRRRQQIDLQGKVVVNAAGPWVDHVLAGLEGVPGPFMGGTKGSHIVVPRFAGAPDGACYVEAAADGRPFFILPWLDRLLIGTTDIRHSGEPDAARADPAEINYLLAETNRVFPTVKLQHADILFHYTGVRPLPRQLSRDESAITRRHIIKHHRRVARGLYSIIGGKLTTYRSLAEEFVDKILRQAKLPAGKCRTRHEPLPGGGDHAALGEQLLGIGKLSTAAIDHLLRVYGTRAADVVALIDLKPALGEEICPATHCLAAEVVFAFEEELATTLADVLARRCMLGLAPDLGRGALSAAAEVGRRHLGWDAARVDAEQRRYLKEIERLA